MKKVQVVVRGTDREQLLEALHDLGVLHIVPIHVNKAVAEVDVAQSLDGVKRAVQILAAITPSSSATNLSANKAVETVLNVQRVQAENDSRLSSLYRQLEQQSMWGDLTADDIEVLRLAEVLPGFYLVSNEIVGQITAELVHVLQEVDKKNVIVAVIDRTGNAQIPEEAEFIPYPQKDNPSIRAEAAVIDANRKKADEKLGELANLLPEIQLLQEELEEKAQFSIANNSALAAEDLFAIQGWIPFHQSATLSDDLDAKGIVAGIRTLDPEEDENPPTLVQYPRWALPIKGLFDMLNTFPGYREIDLAVFFMIAMPIFAAMLTGDGGYGLLFMLPGIIFYKKLANKIGREGTQLLIIFGAAALIWGVLTANFFGVTPETMAKAGGFFVEGNEELTYQNLRDGDGGWAAIGNFMMDAAPLWRESGEDSRELLIKISFLVGSIHLILAHLRRSVSLLPDMRGIANIGWATVLVAMLGLIWNMFFEDDAVSISSSLVMIVLASGMVLVVGFGSPDRNPIKRVGVGIASSLLPLIATFSDTMSYIRLMAVSLASFYIAEAFNTLGATVADSATWAVGALVVIFGHALNMALVVIAIFAHGVRLNMLEFSNNAGVEWAGYAYNPFSKLRT